MKSSARIAAMFNRSGVALITALAAIASLAITAAPALAAPPTVTTPVVSSVSYASAHVEGIFNPHGFAFYNFEYSADGGNTWTPGPGGSLFSEAGELVKADLALEGGTEYAVRLNAHNFLGDNVYSATPDPSFTTLIADPTAVLSVNNASEVAYTTAKATGEIDRPAKSDDVACHFEYITDAAYLANPAGEGFAGATSLGCEPEQSVAATGHVPVSAKLTNLANDTTYHLRLAVSNSTNGDAKEAAQPFTTLTVDPPSVVSIDNAGEVEYTQAQVKGVVERPNTSTDPAFDIDSCNFEYITDAQFAANPPGDEFSGAGSVPCEGESPIHAEGETNVKATLTSLVPQITYHLRLSASNQGGSDARQAAATFATQGPVPTPTVILIDNASEVSYRTAKVTGEIQQPAGEDPALITSCRFEYISDAQFTSNPPGEEFAGAIPVACAETPLADPTPVSADLTGLRSGVTYHLRLVAENAGGTVAKDAADTFTTVPGGDPTFSIDPNPVVGYTTLKVFGTGAYGLGAEDEPLQYVFEVAEAGTENWSGCCGSLQTVPHQVGPQNLSYEFTGLHPGTEYKYRLILIRNSGLIYETSPEPYPTLTTQPLAEPTVTLDAVTTFTGTSAHFSGAVDTHAPAGLLDEFAKAAYKTDWQLECVPACPSNQLSDTVQGEEGSKAISADVKLHANTFYEVKLLAHNSSYSVQSPAQSFQTPLIPADVQAAAGASDGEGGYTIQGVIDSNNSKLTKCEFEWGPNNTYPNAFKAPCLPFPSGPDEVQLLNVDALQGQYRLSFRGQTTTDLGYDATSAEVQSALEALSSVGSGGVSVADGGVAIPEAFSHEITFAGKLAGANVEPIKASDGTTPLCCGGGASVSTTTEGGTDHPVTVEAHLTGLSPGATYHFRIFATNAAGTASSVDRAFIPTLATREECPNETIRGENSSLALPECRAYEQVSNPFKEGYEAILNNFDAGRALQYQSKAPDIANSGEQNPIINNYVATRTTDGWRTIPNLNGPTGSLSAAPSYVTPGSIDGPFVHSRDLLSSVVNFARQPAGQVEREAYLRRPDGTFSLIGHGNPVGSADLQFITDSSADLTHLLYTSTALETTPWGPGVYEFVGTGNDLPDRVDLDNSGTPVSACVGHDPVTGNAVGNAKGQFISEDGDTIVFTAYGCGGATPANEIWARIDADLSVDVSASRCTRTAADPGGPCDGPSAASFVSATPDGSRVFFTTAQQLLDSDTDQTNDLYACDLPAATSTPTGRGNSCGALLEVSGAQIGADVGKAIVISEDGSSAYFTAKGVLAVNEDALGESAEAGDRNLYVWRQDAAHPSGQTRFIGALGNDDQPLGQSTPDGRYLALQTGTPLLATDTDAAADVYRYDADTGELLRVSTAASGTGGNDDSFDASISRPRLGETTGRTFINDSSPTLSDDGGVIGFSTDQTLSPRDANDEGDLYLWRSGRVSLITTGAVNGGLADFNFHGGFALSGSGEDVYFGTEAQLTPSDGDGKADVYDARVDGGFSFARSICSGETCQPEPGESPTPRPLGSQGTGPGNPPTPKSCPRGKVKRHGKCVKKPSRKHSSSRDHGKRANHKQGGGK